jgi:hypothetical protein
MPSELTFNELPAFCTFYHLSKLTLDLNLKKNIEEFTRKASKAEISDQMLPNLQTLEVLVGNQAMEPLGLITYLIRASKQSLKKIIINDNNKHPLINPRNLEVLSDFKNDI